MQVLRTIFSFYINSSIHVALAVCALVGVTWLTYGISYNLSLLGFVFFGTITGYNFVKYAGVARFHHRSLTDALKVVQIFSFFIVSRPHLVCFSGTAQRTMDDRNPGPIHFLIRRSRAQIEKPSHFVRT